MPHVHNVPAVAALGQVVPPRQLTHIVLTHLAPNRVPVLEALLAATAQGRAPGSAQLEVHLTNPAMQLLQSKLGAFVRPLGECMLAVLLPRTLPD
jgi:flavorubredoxin